MGVLSKEIDPHRLTDPERKSFVFKKEFPEIYDAYKRLTHARWTVEEIDLHRDRGDFAKLLPQEQHFIRTILMFFKGGDGVVIENAFVRFMQQLFSAEITAFFSEQLSNENVHSEMYRVLIETTCEDADEAERLLAELEEYPCVKKKMDWAEKWLRDEESDIRKRLLAFVAVEGILFSSSFCGMYWLKTKGLCHGMTHSNELISRDEGLHTDFGMMLYKMFKPLSESEVHSIFKEAFDVEVAFVDEALPAPLNGIDAPTMKKYVKSVINRLCRNLNVTEMFDDAASPGFMDMISVHGKAQFFERQQEYMENDLSSSGNSVPFSWNLKKF